jgi:hypothetical protein
MWLRRGLTVAAVLSVATGAAVVTVALTHTDAPPQPPAASTAPLPAAPPSPGGRVSVLSTSRPTLLDIPRIGVHAGVGSVRLTATGAMDVPVAPHYDQPAWYRYSPTPGARGPAVIVGHVDSKSGPSVFFRLGALRIGDRISVQRVDGEWAQFVVRDVQRFSKDRFPTALVYGNTSDAELRLITCGGSFDRASGHYRDNVVVFAAFSG